MTYSPEQLASVGDYILTNRQFFEERINSRIKTISEGFKTAGVKVDRIAKNHAICSAGISCLMELLKFPNDEVIDFYYSMKLAHSKTETARSELPIADLFMSYVKELNEHQGIAIEKGILVIHLPTALRAIEENWNKSELMEQLKLMDNFIEKKLSRAIDKHKPKECWIFKINETDNFNFSTLQPYKSL